MTQGLGGMGSGGRGTGGYYGWKVLFALFMAGFMVYGGGLYSFVLFVPPLTEEFHWSRAATSWLVTAFWLSAPLILLGGPAIRRFGATRLLIAGIVIEAVCIVLLSTVSSFWQMYALRAAMGLGKVMFAVTLPYTISRWFTRRHSFGLGITWAGWHFGGMLLAPLTGWVIAGYGWRAACMVIAAGLVTIGVIPTLLTQRVKSPRELGLGADGDPLDGLSADAAAEVAAAARAEDDSPRGSLGDLLRSSMFWIIGLVSLFFYTTYGGLLTQEAAVVEGAGFSPRDASLVLGSTAGFAALGGLTVGWVLDRFSIRAVAVTMHLMLLIGALSLLVAAREHSMAALVSYAVFFGITIGGGDIYFVAVLRRRFPHVSLAYSYSAFYFCEILALMMSGPATGTVFDLTHNYNLALTLLSGSAVLALGLSYFVLKAPGLEAPAQPRA